MQLVLEQYDYNVTRNSNFRVQNRQSCQEIPNCSNFKLIMTIYLNFNKIGVFDISKVI